MSKANQRKKRRTALREAIGAGVPLRVVRSRRGHSHIVPGDAAQPTLCGLRLPPEETIILGDWDKEEEQRLADKGSLETTVDCQQCSYEATLVAGVYAPDGDVVPDGDDEEDA